MTVRTGFIRTAIGLVTAGLLPLTLAVPAEAATYPYDGRDPIAAGCASDATTKASSHLHAGNDWSVAYVELRYSVACHTAWARLSNAYGPVYKTWGGGGALIHRNSDGKEYTCSLDSENDKTCYTAMVYDKDPITSSAYGQDDDWSIDGGVSAWTSPY